MSDTRSILKVVGRVTGRVRMWRLIGVFISVAKWTAICSLPLYVVNLIWALPAAVVLLPPAVFTLAFLVLAVRSLAGLSPYEVAKIVDDQLGFDDRLTSALFFEKHAVEGRLARAAVAQAGALADSVDTARLSVGAWPRYTPAVMVLFVLTAAVAVGPVNLAGIFSSTGEQKSEDVAVRDNEGTPEAPIAPDTVRLSDTRLERKEPVPVAEALQTERPPERDPESFDVEMDPALEEEIENIKASVNLTDMKELEEAFKDDEKKGAGEERNEPPPRIAPLDKELLDDIVRSKKEKMKKGEGSNEDSIGVAVKMPAKPGAKDAAPKTGRGGHGGGDVGESGDTRGAARRVPIAGRDKVIIESRRSTDILEKTDLEKMVMNEVMMRLSMDDITMTGKATPVEAKFSDASPRKPVVHEPIPLGRQGYVQRYFEGLGGRRTGAESKTPEETETP